MAPDLVLITTGEHHRGTFTTPAHFCHHVLWRRSVLP